jgi:hypothetical protein
MKPTHSRAKGKASFALRLVCAFTVVCAIFAHRAIYASENELPAYTLPDGTTLAHCLGGSDGERQKTLSPIGCEFCRLANAVLLPSPAAVARACLTDSSAVGRKCDELQLDAWFILPGAPPTGPPA